MTIPQAKSILEAPFVEFGAYVEAQNTILATIEREGTRTFINKLEGAYRDQAILSIARKLFVGAA